MALLVLGPARGRADGLGALAALAVGLAGAAPLVDGRIPWGHDFVFHVFRLQALDQHLHQGFLFPRWFETFVFGYGYPLLHFYGPLSYYLGHVFHLLGAGYPAAFALACVTSRLIGALGAYLLGRRILGSPLAGVVVAVVFALLPYQLTDLYVRAALPELLALNLLPLVLWSVDRAVDRATLARIAGAALALAGMVLAHQTTAALNAGVVALFSAFRLAGDFGVVGRGTTLHRVVALSIVAGLALILSAFFWLPALADQAYVRLEGQPPGFPPFVDLLVRPERLFAATLVTSYEWPEPTRIGLVEGLVALLGAACLTVVPRSARAPLLFGVAVFAAAAVLMTDLARPFWSTVQFGRLMQFPFRMRGESTLAAALLAGGLARLPWRTPRWALSAGAVGLVAWTSIAALRPPMQSVRAEAIDPGGFARYELSRFWPATGTTVPGQFLPVWVEMKPEELAWSRRRTLTPAPELDAHVAVVGTAPGELRLRTQAADPFDLRLHRFYAPHWRAWLDGRPVGVSAHGVRGLVSVAVPGGTHELLLGEQRAPLYTAANAASAAAFAAVLVMLGTAWVHLRPALLGGATAALVAGLLALPALVGRAPSEVHAADLSFEAGLSLVGWSQQPAPHRVGEALAVDLYWLVRREIGTDQDVVLRLLDADGRERAVLRRAPRWGAAPTSTWTRGELVHDQHELTLPEGLPAGTYVLEAGLAEAGGARVERLVAGEIELPAASSRANPALPAGLVPFPVDFEDGISLVGYVPGPGAPPATRRLAPGGMVELTLVWRVREETPHDVATSLFLADARGEKWG